MGNRKHLEILKQGKDEWNSFKDHYLETPDFSGFNLDDMDLQGYHLDNSYFYESSLKHCNLNEAWLTSCVFIRTALNNTSMINPQLEAFNGDKRLLGVNLRWSTFADCDLTSVIMTGATLEGAQFHKCNFGGPIFLTVKYLEFQLGVINMIRKLNNQTL